MPRIVPTGLVGLVLAVVPMAITFYQMSLEAEKDAASAARTSELQSVAFESMAMVAAAESKRADDAISLRDELIRRMDALRDDLEAARERCGG